MEKYNDLIVLETFMRNSKRRAKVKCVCGTIKDCDYYSVKSGETTSCGCRRKRNTVELNKLKNKMDEYIGKEYITNEGCNIKVIDYKDRMEVTVKFLDEFEGTVTTTMQNIKKGQVKNPFLRTVFNIGYYGKGKYKARINRKKSEEYVRWYCMFNRCYNEKFQNKNPWYKGCTVDKSFHCFQDFAKWYNENIYDFDEELEVDKDLLKEGNKIYSSSNCCIIPKKLNNAIKYKRNDKIEMKKIYDEYNGRLPEKIMKALEKLI